MRSWIDDVPTEDDAGVNGLLISAFGRGAQMVCRPEHFARTWDLVRSGMLVFGPGTVPNRPVPPLCMPGEQVRILMARVDALRFSHTVRTVTRVTVESVPADVELNLASVPAWLPDPLAGRPVLMTEAMRALNAVGDVLICHDGHVQSCGESAVVAWVGRQWRRMSDRTAAVPQPNVEHLEPVLVSTDEGLPPLARVGAGGDVSPVRSVDGAALPAAEVGFTC